jgi:hypothetical protein
MIAAGANVLAAVLALAVLKPWRARVVERSGHDAVLEVGAMQRSDARAAPTVQEFERLSARVKTLEEQQAQLANMMRRQSA